MVRFGFGSRLFDVFVISFCSLFAFVCFYPLWYVFLASIMSYEDFVRQTIIFLPPLHPTFEHYKVILSGQMFQNAFYISVMKTALGAVLAVLLTSMLAYSVSKKHVRGMSLVNYLVIFTMFFGGGLIPTYLLMKDLHLLNTFWVMVIPALIAPFNFIIMRNYFEYTVSQELEDAATIDGANEIVLFYRIILPLSAPMVAAIFLFEAVAHWNDYYSYLIYVDDVRLQPFVWILRRLLIDPTISGSEDGITTGEMAYIPPASLRMTVIICATLPILIIYPFLQRHFAQGLMIGAVKE